MSKIEEIFTFAPMHFLTPFPEKNHKSGIYLLKVGFYEIISALLSD